MYMYISWVRELIHERQYILKALIHFASFLSRGTLLLSQSLGSMYNLNTDIQLHHLL